MSIFSSEISYLLKATIELTILWNWKWIDIKYVTCECLTQKPPNHYVLYRERKITLTWFRKKSHGEKHQKCNFHIFFEKRPPFSLEGGNFLLLPEWYIVYLNHTMPYQKILTWHSSNPQVLYILLENHRYPNRKNSGKAALLTGLRELLCY
jgi:hypothetical protein